MDIKTERRDGILTFAIHGRLDGYGAGQLADAVEASLQADDRSVVFDLAGMSYLSSAGIRVLIVVKRRLKERGGILALAGMQDYPKNVLDMAGVTPIFSLYRIQVAVAACRRSKGVLCYQRPCPGAGRDGVAYTVELNHAERVAPVTGDLIRC